MRLCKSILFKFIAILVFPIVFPIALLKIIINKTRFWVYSSMRNRFKDLKFKPIIVHKPESVAPKIFITPEEELRDWYFKRSHYQEESCRSIYEIIGDYAEYCNDPIKWVNNSKIKLETKTDQIEDFHRAHRWILQFGDERIDNAFKYCESLEFTRKPGFIKPGLFKVKFYSSSKTLDFLASKPSTRMGRLDYLNKSGDTISYMEINRIKFVKADIINYKHDYTSTDINRLEVTFKFSKCRMFGMVAENGPASRPIVC